MILQPSYFPFWILLFLHWLNIVVHFVFSQWMSTNDCHVVRVLRWYLNSYFQKYINFSYARANIGEHHDLRSSILITGKLSRHSHHAVSTLPISQKWRYIYFLFGTELQIIVSGHVGAGNQTQILWTDGSTHNHWALSPAPADTDL